MALCPIFLLCEKCVSGKSVGPADPDDVGC